MYKALSAGGAQAEEMVLAIIEAINAYTRKLPHQPSWAARWKTMSGYLQDRAEGWCSCVGVPVFDRDWVIVLKYTVGETGTLLRPTQIDAGTRAWHFPSPPERMVHEGGLAMHLGSDCPDLVPEFIHQAIPHIGPHWKDAGRLCRQVAVAHEDVLEKYRTLHYDRLVRAYGSGIRAWMGSCL
jgi:hypothetical protein